MKKILVLLIVSIFIFSCNENKKEDVAEGFKISGKIEGMSDSTIYLQKRVEREFVNIDTCKLDAEGVFEFAGKVEIPEMYYVLLEEKKYISFFIENSEININCHFDSLQSPQVTGSGTHDVYSKYQSETKEFDVKTKALYEEWKEAKEAEDEEKLAEIEERWEELDAKKAQFNVGFIKEHGESVVAAWIGYRNSYSIELEELKEIVSALDSTVIKSIYAISLAERIIILEKTAEGQPITDFSQNDADGNPISLSSYKGKYVLVDFWASWCSPCRQANPHVVKLYNKYNDRGFDVFGVSFDEDRDDWLKAIEDDGLVWNQVSDLAGWDNTAGKLYGIKGIPHTMLVSPEGIILAHNLTTDELEAKLVEIFGE